MSDYDSTEDTLKHIKKVNEYLLYCCVDLMRRAATHDDTKLESPEKELFDKYTPKLKDSTYGSDEYYEFLDGLQEALDHHYKYNSHHPEHYEEGIKGMNLFDVVEMLMDWKAATERHDDGDIYKSLEINQDRFEYSDELKRILTNTAKYLEW